MKHIYNTYTHGQGSISPWLIFGAHDDKASSRASLLTGGREATSKKTLKEASSRSTPRTAVIHMSRLIVGEILSCRTYLWAYLFLTAFSLSSGGEESMWCSFLTTGAKSESWQPEWNCRMGVCGTPRGYKQDVLKCCTMMKMKSSRIRRSRCHMTNCQKKTIVFCTLLGGCYCWVCSPHKNKRLTDLDWVFFFLDDN